MPTKKLKKYKKSIDNKKYMCYHVVVVERYQHQKRKEFDTMKKLIEYAHLSVHGENGLKGDCLELALHDLVGDDLAVSARGVVDIRLKVSAKVKTCNKVEIKSGAGQIPHNLKGNSYIVYCPVVDLEKTILEQEAFIMPREVFIQCLQDSGCYRESKRTTAGSYTEAIQTFWNNAKNEPHGKKYYKLLDALYASECLTLQEFFEE